ncbi:hypothetical protein ACU4HD_34930 [Cupriavidus basilensis]
MTRAWGKTLLMVALVLAAAGAAVFATTRGLRTVSADGARRLDLARAPRELPALVLLDQAGARHAFGGAAADKGGAPLTLVTFVYTQCTAVCRTSASGQGVAAAAIARAPLAGQRAPADAELRPGA